MDIKTDQQRFNKCLTILGEVFRPIPGILAPEYWAACEAYSIEQVEKAVSHVVREYDSAYRPTPGQLRKIVQDLSPPRRFKALPAPPPTPKEATRVSYRCQFAIWVLTGGIRTGQRIKRHDRQGRWRQVLEYQQVGKPPKLDRDNWSQVWLGFLQRVKAPQWLIAEAQEDCR